MYAWYLVLLSIIQYTRASDVGSTSFYIYGFVLLVFEFAPCHNRPGQRIIVCCNSCNKKRLESQALYRQSTVQYYIFATVCLSLGSFMYFRIHQCEGIVSNTIALCDALQNLFLYGWVYLLSLSSAYIRYQCLDLQELT